LQLYLRRAFTTPLNRSGQFTLMMRMFELAKLNRLEVNIEYLFHFIKFIFSIWISVTIISAVFPSIWLVHSLPWGIWIYGKSNLIHSFIHFLGKIFWLDCQWMPLAYFELDELIWKGIISIHWTKHFAHLAMICTPKTHLPKSKFAIHFSVIVPAANGSNGFGAIHKWLVDGNLYLPAKFHQRKYNANISIIDYLN